MRVADFDFDLPPERIALRPVVPRDAARLLVVRGDGLEDRVMSDLPGVLRTGDVLVFNDTRVIPAQLSGHKYDAKVRVTLHQRVGNREWWSFVKNAKRLKVGDRIDFGSAGAGGLSGVVQAKGDDGSVRWRFDSALPFDEALELAGQMPLPPYISSKRAVDAQDLEDYQTVYAKQPGAVAAPTAGLHFTPGLLAALDAAGVQRETVTLHVGAGTFLPVKADDTDDHRMHAEMGQHRRRHRRAHCRRQGRGAARSSPSARPARACSKAPGVPTGRTRGAATRACSSRRASRSPSSTGC